MTELRHDDLPAPVAPAMRMWGIWARFISTARPLMSRPTATSRGWRAARASAERRMSPSFTTSRSTLGTSTPTARWPGMGARILTSGEAMARAMSLRRLSSLETLIPSPSSSTNRVTVGPTTGSSRVVGTPNLARVSRSSRPRSPTSARSTSRDSVDDSRSGDGSFHPEPAGTAAGSGRAGGRAGFLAGGLAAAGAGGAGRAGSVWVAGG